MILGELLEEPCVKWDGALDCAIGLLGFGADWAAVLWTTVELHKTIGCNAVGLICGVAGVFPKAT